MLAKLENGHTSFAMAFSIAKMMHKVRGDYVLVTKYYDVKHPIQAKRMGKLKFIFLAYDAESKIFEGTVWDEMKWLYNNRPFLIITVSDFAANFYKRIGFNSYYLPMGYDDLNYRRFNCKRTMELCFAGSVDKTRASVFYHRDVICDEITKHLKKKDRKAFLTNGLKYEEVNRFYSSSLLGLNDIIRGINMRCFEIPSNGCFMLVNNVIRNLNYPLKEGRHYEVYVGITDLLEKIDYLVDDKEGTIEKAEKAREIILKHPLSKNVEKMIKDCKLEVKDESDTPKHRADKQMPA